MALALRSGVVAQRTQGPGNTLGYYAPLRIGQVGFVEPGGLLSDNEVRQPSLGIRRSMVFRKVEMLLFRPRDNYPVRVAGRFSYCFSLGLAVPLDGSANAAPITDGRVGGYPSVWKVV